MCFSQKIGCLSMFFLIFTKITSNGKSITLYLGISVFIRTFAACLAQRSKANGRESV